ncbi:phosphoribosyltransferase family protein [Halospeciosus flavus]|uniref:Phosphoribosyltransferase family protein n=1 Tax=Halospeciosus flavus TaxID=3032283 RepID=A0ABD5YYQ6_9EURY|nr:phosphoribosyltransferase family protein [Halospeciosus flavus]
MEWSEYRNRIESPEDEYRTNVPALFADPDTFDAFVNDLATELDPSAFDYVARIDAMGFIPGTALARRFGVGFIAVRKDEKLPIREEHRVADTLVDYTGKEKMLEVDTRQVPTDDPILLVDDWMETASQVGTAIDLLERAGGTVGGIALLAAEENETTRRLNDEYGVYSVKSFRE